MSTMWVTGFTLFLTAHGLTAMEHYSNDTFPPLPPEFRNASCKLMKECFDMGHRVPPMMDNAPNSDMAPEDMDYKSIPTLQNLLYAFSRPPGTPSPSGQPNDTTGSPDGMDWDWMDMTERLQNCSRLPDMIDFIKNYSNGPRCFMQAFMAPFSWISLMADDSDVDPRDLKMLIWAAKPFIKKMLPSKLMLPPRPRPPHLAGMANMFSEEFGSLTPKQRHQIHKWLMDHIKQSNPNCGMKPPKPGMGPGPQDRPGQRPGHRGRPFCRNWLNATGMGMMGRFLTLLPVDEFQDIRKEELCAFFWKPKFQDSVRGPFPRHLGRMMFRKVKDKCFNRSSEVNQHLSRLGSLACFFDQPNELNSSLCTDLLSQLEECENSDAKRLKRKLVMKALSSQNQGPLTPEFLKSLGEGASVVPASMLNKVRPSDLKKVMSSMCKTNWKPVQARILARKLLQEGQPICGSGLIGLGTMVKGVSSKVLRKTDLMALKSEDLMKLSQRMSRLQRAAVLDGLRSNLSASELVQRVSGPLVARLSLSTLEDANLNSVDQLEGKNWTRSQSALLVKKILGKRLRPSDIKKLKSAVQGVTCRMIEKTNQSDVQEMSLALTESMCWLSRMQMRCAAKKLYSSLQNQRAGYFTNITDAELNAIPTPLLICMPVKAITGLPDSVCSTFLDKMSQANLSTLPLSSIARSAVTNRALACLGKNVSDLSTDDITRLGQLVCELGPTQLSSLGADVRNTTLLALAECLQINRKHRGAIFKLLREEYGEPSNWSSSTMTSHGRLLLLDDAEINSLTYKPWLKQALEDILDGLPKGLSRKSPKEFQICPKMAAVQKKLFYLTTYFKSNPAARRKREACDDAPTLDDIVSLGEANLNWNATDLACISADVFNNGVQTLGEVVGYSIDQLEALRAKVVEVWGPPGSLSESQVLELGCVSRGFTSAELRELNITSLDTFGMINQCNWEQDQREALWQGFVNRRQQTVGALGAVDFVGLGQFICGLSLGELRNLSTDAFGEAVADVGTVECPLSSMEVLKEKAVALFGSPGAWTEAQVSSIGNIIAGLNESELQSLNESVLPFVSQTAIPLITPSRFAALSVSQLLALGPDNAAMVTDAQRAMLSEAQQNALDEAIGVPYTRTVVSTQSSPVLTTKGGASRLGIVGTLVFLQQFLFLTLWYAA